MKSLRSKKVWLAALILSGVAVIAWSQRGPVWAWHCVRQLSQADEESRAHWEEQVADLEEAALPSLLNGLRNRDASVCANLHGPLQRLAKNWGPTHEKTHALAEQLRDRFDEFSPAGQEKAVLVVSSMLQADGPKPLPPRLTKVAGDILQVADRRPELRGASLVLAAELVDGVEPGQWVDVARELAERGLQDDAVGIRVAALHLLMREPMRKDKELLEKTIPCLRDAAPAVRRAAVLVLAAESDLVREESFLPLLHDDDAEVQHLVEMALRKRKLTDQDIEIARMISAKEAGTRMRVLQHLHRVHDFNVGGLLRQLSLDPAPAVRAAAARAAGENPHVDFAERLREMAADDPSETVRQNAQFYLQLRARRGALD